MKSIQISIPEPCHEDWAKMTPKDKGRFCDACEKVVVDMTKLTDHEIYHLVDTGKKICGRFRNDQLNRPMSPRVPLKSKKSHWAIAASLLVGLSFLASCEEEPVVGELEAIEQKDTTQVSTNETKSNKSLDGEFSIENVESLAEILRDSNKKAGQITEFTIVGDTIIKNLEIEDEITSGVVVPEVVEPKIENNVHYLGQPVVKETTDTTKSNQ